MLGACEFIPRCGINFIKRPTILKYCEAFTRMRNDIKKARVYVEFFMIFYFVVMSVMGYYSFIILLIYGHYVKFRFKLCFQAQNIINGIKDYAIGKVLRLGALGSI